MNKTENNVAGKDFDLIVMMQTYNHEFFIKQAIEGVLAQQTTYSYKLFIIDDCSTDDTYNICKLYADTHPNKITLIKNDTNLGAYKTGKKLRDVCFNFPTKYTAICEGDDYWTDLKKLQKQVDFLEANPDYSICWTKYKNLRNTKRGFDYSDTTLEEPDWVSLIENKAKLDIDLNNFLAPYMTYALTVTFKSRAIDLYLFDKMKHAKDNTIYCMCLSKGKGAILNFFGGVYRIHSGGIYSSSTLLDQRYSSFLNLKEIIQQVNGCNNSNLKNIRNWFLLESFRAATVSNQRKFLFKRLRLYLKILKYGSMPDKIEASDSLFKQFFNIAKNKSQKLRWIKLNNNL